MKKPTQRQLNRWIKEDEDYAWGYRPKPTLWRRFLRWVDL